MKNDKMKFQYRVNEQIHAREVRVVNEGNAEVMSTRQALDIARKEGVDNHQFAVSSTILNFFTSKRNIRKR